MKKIALVILVLSITLSSHATLMEVVGTFSGAPQGPHPSGRIRLLSGGFKAYFDDALVPTTGYAGLADLTPAEFFLNDPLIGDTTFDLTNTYLDLGFHNGVLTSFLLGDSANNLTQPGIDDFLAYFEHDGALTLASFAVTEKRSGYFGTDFRTNDPTSGSFAVTPVPTQAVPDSLPTALCLVFGVAGVVAMRRGQSFQNPIGCPA